MYIKGLIHNQGALPAFDPWYSLEGISLHQESVTSHSLQGELHGFKD